MGESAGRSGRRWRALREQIKAAKPPCYYDGQPIDYDAKWPLPDSFSVDHKLPRSQYPELAEDPGNLVACHLRCNQVKGDRAEIRPTLGNRSEDW